MERLKKRVVKMGELTVELRRCKMNQKTEPLAHIGLEGVDEIPEKALKGRSLSHSVA